MAGIPSGSHMRPCTDPITRLTEISLGLPSREEFRAAMEEFDRIYRINLEAIRLIQSLTGQTITYYPTGVQSRQEPLREPPAPSFRIIPWGSAEWVAITKRNKDRKISEEVPRDDDPEWSLDA